MTSPSTRSRSQIGLVRQSCSVPTSASACTNCTTSKAHTIAARIGENSRNALYTSVPDESVSNAVPSVTATVTHTSQRSPRKSFLRMCSACLIAAPASPAPRRSRAAPSAVLPLPALPQMLPAPVSPSPPARRLSPQTGQLTLRAPAASNSPATARAGPPPPPASPPPPRNRAESVAISFENRNFPFSNN